MGAFQEALPVAGEPVRLEVGDGERETVVNADDGRSVRREFLAEPLSETTTSPISHWAGRRSNLFLRAGTLGNVKAAIGHRFSQVGTLLDTVRYARF